ncbi:hypothetical protein U0070_001497 [Myodes glareolus]|uniref:Rhombotin-2 n=1 Tax=Myodes glareolus TaxID=447135 RepID=A0AAW0IDZ5_MYOGA
MAFLRKDQVEMRNSILHEEHSADGRPERRQLTQVSGRSMVLPLSLPDPSLSQQLVSRQVSCDQATPPPIPNYIRGPQRHSLHLHRLKEEPPKTEFWGSFWFCQDSHHFPVALATQIALAVGVVTGLGVSNWLYLRGVNQSPEVILVVTAIKAQAQSGTCQSNYCGNAGYFDCSEFLVALYKLNTNYTLIWRAEAMRIHACEMTMRVKDNVYHLECFKCAACRKHLCVGDRYFPINSDINKFFYEGDMGN